MCGGDFGDFGGGDCRVGDDCRCGGDCPLTFVDNFRLVCLLGVGIGSE